MTSETAGDGAPQGVPFVSASNIHKSFGGVRALEGPTSLTGVTRFASDTYCEGLATKDGVVPIPNVLPYDAPR